MKQITEQQIRQRAKYIGNRPAFPNSSRVEFKAELKDGKLITPPWVEYMKGMTYRMWLIGQYVANPTGRKEEILNDVQYVLEQLAKAELEAEQEVSND
jgi:hypothetical protein